MEREFWKAGNMLYPLPAVMVSCQRPGEKPNIITLAWVDYLFGASHGFHIHQAAATFL